ncbi:uncharacterized protein LOC110980660 [Acanthaster planci]|uniref:Uncharacterized protein LOC110980660 n=1 Tax=Acanthaster planci TaxID=133434 RepID=A0A8B7YJ15_ACAPL|nr:uncharacterized protein LOC110980660 [Acanthaster planci]
MPTPCRHLQSKESLTKHTVVNMSKRSLSSSEEKVLALGLNFKLIPRSLPKEEIIQATEPTLRRLDKTTADEILVDISQALRKHKNHKPKPNREDRSAIKSLCQDKSIHILLADKGNATVVMDRVEYDQKIMDILNSGSYRELRIDPTVAIERKLQQKLLSLHRSGNITEQLYRQLRPSNSRCPRFFGQPKIHKKETPLRPIVASRGGPTNNTARHLAKILRPLVGNSQHHIKNSDEFLSIIQDLRLKPGDIMVSFDVVSLLTSVHPTQALPPPQDLAPPVDDTFVIWEHGQDNLQLFLDHLNGLHSNIQFTMEQERNGSILFLDVEVSRREDGSLAQRVYRKPTHTDRYLNSASFHHPKINSSVNRALIRRAYNIGDQKHLHKEIHHISTALQRNGYQPKQIKTDQDPRSNPLSGRGVPYTQSQLDKAPSSVTLPYLGHTSYYIQRILSKHNIKVFHTAPLKIHGMLASRKDRQDPHRRPGVYKIPCQCGKVYIGETGRGLPTRIKEHKAHGRKGDYEKSVIIKHSHAEDHTITGKKPNSSLASNNGTQDELEKWVSYTRQPSPATAHHQLTCISTQVDPPAAYSFHLTTQ